MNIPGAVPFGFGSTTASSITIAWREFRSGIVTPKLWKRCRISASTTSSSNKRRPSARAVILRVMSSSVGPRPPVVITTFERRTASLIASSRRASSSPTIVLSFTSMPMALSFSVSQRLLVSVRSGASSSEPIAMISAVSVSNNYFSLSERNISRQGAKGEKKTPKNGKPLCVFFFFVPFALLGEKSSLKSCFVLINVVQHLRDRRRRRDSAQRHRRRKTHFLGHLDDLILRFDISFFNLDLGATFKQ